VDNLQQLRRGTVRISSMEGAVPRVLFRAVRAFTREHPQITFEVTCGGTEAQITVLLRNECDLSILMDPPPNPEVLVECAISDPVCAVVHPGHRLAKRRSIRLAELVNERLARMDESSVTRTRLDRAALRDRVRLPVLFTVNHSLHTYAFPRREIGVAFGPRHSFVDDVAAGLLVAIPIKNPVLSRSRTALCRHRSRPLSRAAKAFLSVLKEELLQMESVKW